MKKTTIISICGILLAAGLLCAVLCLAKLRGGEDASELPEQTQGQVSEAVRKAYLSYPDTGYVAYPGGLPTPSGAVFCADGTTEYISADDPRLIRLTNCISHAMFRMAETAECESDETDAPRLILCFEGDGDGDSVRYIISGRTVCRVYHTADDIEYRSARSYRLADIPVDDWTGLAGF